ncbi:hypothetical protein GCM10011316_10180 [Roseibium aquae]|uniref:EF-hand domain-containing protein n=1 Tax=Roseibium aquae TaxID=1323746 RepID=A0A916TDQ3_9HYPH|nr:EF-hand domain-containing protein [Roseibium aquae]GGB40087.1 hypothetical protein GCM10011316_10180 [Roseibium aquae]
MIRTTTAAALTAAYVLSGTAMAQGMSFEQVDRDQNGVVSFEELSVAIPNITQEAFDAADANRDLVLDPQEFEALDL